MRCCSVVGCKQKHLARNFCSAHYQRQRTRALFGPPIKPIGWENKTTRKSLKSPAIIDVAWAAGFLEGDGSFTTAGKPPKYPCECVKATQVNKEPLQRCLDLFGGGLHQGSRDHRPNHNPVWVWHVSGSRARGVMMTLYLFLSGKRRAQIRKALHGNL